jgi:hypothetical protein
MKVAPPRFSVHHERTYVKNRGATVEDKSYGAIGGHYFGPNFDIAPTAAVPEPATLAPAVLAALAGAGYSSRKRRRPAV